MKIYTIDRCGISNFVKVESRFLPDGRKIPAFVLGEEGRGRKLVFVPVTLAPASQQKWERDGWAAVEDVKVGVNKKGYIHLFELDKPSEEDEYIIVFLGWIGFRGHNSLTDCDGNRLGGDTVLAEGIIAQGEAGRMGWGSQWLLRVKVGDRFRYKVTGRLYGDPGDLVVVCTKNGPVIYSEEVYDAIESIKS